MTPRSWALMEASNGDLHVVPGWEAQHLLRAECYCCPVLEMEAPQTGRRVYTHAAREDAN